MTREFIDFINAHKEEDTARLLLSASRYPDIDMPAAVQQIEGMRTAAEKWPSLLRYNDYMYPPRINREQSSSDATAAYKARLILPTTDYPLPTLVADLTGGMGVDTMAFARAGAKVDYVEREQQLCLFMEHNARVLGFDNIAVHNVDCIEWLAQCGPDRYDMIFVDPARRLASGCRVTAFEDCTPDIMEHLGLLRSRCKCLMVKASPMIDISEACRQLGQVAEVHIVSLKGECKEVLFLCGNHDGEAVIECVNIKGDKTDTFSFTYTEESAAAINYSPGMCRYLYEPDSSLMKGGPYKLIGERWGIEKLARNTHLYTSDCLLDGFPGRCFEVIQELKLDRKSLATSIPQHKAHVVTRNYPVEAASLQRQLGLKEGGDVFVVATTIGTRKTGFLCRMINR